MKMVILNDLVSKSIIAGQITQFRKVVEPQKLELWGNEFVCDILSVSNQGVELSIYKEILEDLAIYKPKDILAIAQSYESISLERENPNSYPFWSLLQQEAGWSDKIFVRPEMMPHHIEINNISLSRLFDLKESDYSKCGISSQEGKWLTSIISSQRFDTVELAYKSYLEALFDDSIIQENPVCISYDFSLFTGNINNNSKNINE